MCYLLPEEPDLPVGEHDVPALYCGQLQPQVRHLRLHLVGDYHDGGDGDGGCGGGGNGGGGDDGCCGGGGNGGGYGDGGCGGGGNSGGGDDGDDYNSAVKNVVVRCGCESGGGNPD